MLHKDKPTQTLKYAAILLVGAWTITILLILVIALKQEYNDTMESIRIRVEAAFEKDLIYRRWAAGHGGVYVPVTEETRPNPYLSQIRNREVTTTSGINLTLINPAYMIRQVYALEKEQNSVRGHITSLTPIRPGNAPDAWETRALQSLNQNVPEVSELTTIGDKEFFRLMRPLVTEERCLKCHADQGYQVGDQRGGISISLPMESIRDTMYTHMSTISIGYILIWLLGSGTLLAGIYIIGQRIRARDLATKALEESEENLRTTLNSIGDAVIVTDTEGKVTDINPIGEKLTGYKFSEAKGKPLADILHISSRRSLVNADNTLVNEDNTFKGILANDEQTGRSKYSTLIAKDGTEYQVAITAAPIEKMDGSISGTVLALQDMTELDTVEEELYKARNLESVGLLAGGIAHDFNNILTGLFGNIELAKAKLPQDHQSLSYLDSATKAFARANHLTKQLLTFAKGGDPILEPVNLADIIDSSVKATLGNSKVKPVLNLPDHLWQVKADKDQLSQILANLTINALQAMPTGGCIYFDAENINQPMNNDELLLPGKFVKLSIRDEGSGIAKDIINNIFDPYFTTKRSGSGLGLATTYNIVTRHNGQISVDSQPGVGTTFTIILPAVTAARQSPLTTLDKLPELPKTSSRHVLVMDDEEMIRDFIKEILTEYGFAVACAGDGEEAIEKFLAAKNNDTLFDVVIMDLTIPGGMGGKEAVQKILDIEPSARVIVSSGYSNDPVLANFAEYGFKGRIVKPFQPGDLHKEITRVLSLD